MATFRSLYTLGDKEISVSGTGNISVSSLEKFLRIRIGRDGCIVTLSYEEAAALMQELHTAMKESVERP